LSTLLPYSRVCTFVYLFCVAVNFILFVFIYQIIPATLLLLYCLRVLFGIRLARDIVLCSRSWWVVKVRCRISNHNKHDIDVFCFSNPTVLNSCFTLFNIVHTHYYHCFLDVLCDLSCVVIVLLRFQWSFTKIINTVCFYTKSFIIKFLEKIMFSAFGGIVYHRSHE